MKIEYCAFVAEHKDSSKLEVAAYRNNSAGYMTMTWTRGDESYELEHRAKGGKGLWDETFWRVGFLTLLMKMSFAVTGEPVKGTETPDGEPDIQDNPFILGWLNTIPFDAFRADRWKEAEVDDDGNIVHGPEENEED